MGKMLAPFEQHIIVLPGATFNIATPLATALIADLASAKAINATRCMTEDSVWNPANSETNTRKSLADEQGVANRGAAVVEGMISAFREDDPTTNTTSAYLLLYEALKVKQTPIVWLRRLGRKWNVAPAATHKYSMANWVTDELRIIQPGDSGGPIEYEVPLGFQGTVKMRTALG